MDTIITDSLKKQPLKILCIGEALIDMICTDHGKSLSQGENFLKKTGGAPTNVAAAIGALGGQVSMSAKVGDDAFGHQLIDTMKSFGVSTEYILLDQQHFTTLAFVSLMEDGERDFVFNRGADGQLSEADIEAIELDDYGIVHFGSATAFLPGPLQQAYISLLKKAQQKNLFISFDPNYRQLLFKNNLTTFIEQSWFFMQHCNFLKLSDEEAMLITNTAVLMEAAEILSKQTTALFTITLGKDGTLLGYKGAISILPSIPIKPIDTTGAGDAFVGAVLFQLSQLNNITDLPVDEWNTIITNANKAGARTCEYLGAMEAFKHLTTEIFN